MVFREIAAFVAWSVIASYSGSALSSGNMSKVRQTGLLSAAMR